MTFYFMICVWLGGEKPSDYMHDICQKIYTENRIYAYRKRITDCLDY